MLRQEAIPAWPFTIMKSHPHLWKLRNSFIVPPVGILSKIFFDYLSKSAVYNRETLLEAVGSRPAGQGLVTVCNHYSCLDEPVLNGMLRWRHLLNPNVMRWSPAAYDICFTRPFHSWFFSSGKCVPIVRGEGVYQRAMNFLVDRLQRGDWVHIFPEGRVNIDHEHLRLKWGVGRLVAEPTTTPTVLPFWHLGMDAALPNRTPYVPRVRQTITVVVGRPLSLAADVAQLRCRGASGREARRAITARVQDELERLRSEAERLHAARLNS